MESCDQCLSLEDRLRHANEHYVSLVLQQAKLSLDRNAGVATIVLFEDAIQRSESMRTSLVEELQAHRATHKVWSRPISRTAGGG